MTENATPTCANCGAVVMATSEAEKRPGGAGYEVKNLPCGCVLRRETPT